MSASDLPGVPEPVRATVRAVPILNPVVVVIAGVLYGVVFGVGVALWWGVSILVGGPSLTISLRTGLVLWGLGVAFALGRDANRKRRMAVAVSPGWISRSVGSRTVTVPRAEITRVRVRTSLVDRLVGTKTFDVFDADGHRLRLPRVREADDVERALADHIDDARP